jgi:hypothetical protein
LRLAVPPPGQAGDRGADNDPAEKPGHVFADVRVPGDLNTISKRFGGTIVPGREIRKCKDRNSKGHTDHKGQDDVEVAVDPTAKLLRHLGPPIFSFDFSIRRKIRPEGYNPSPCPGSYRWISSVFSQRLLEFLFLEGQLARDQALEGGWDASALR